MNEDLRELEPALRNARAGDRQAIAELVDWLRPRVRLRAQGILGRKFGARLDASDVAQEVCLRIHGRLGQFEGHTAPQLLGWVETILRNVVADFHKHHAARKRDAGREVAGHELFQGLAAEGTSPSQRVMKGELAAGLEEALGRLPTTQRLVFRLRFLEDLPFAEVARRAGVSPGNARVLFLRAIERLRTKMGGLP